MIQCPPHTTPMTHPIDFMCKLYHHNLRKSSCGTCAVCHPKILLKNKIKNNIIIIETRFVFDLKLHAPVLVGCGPSTVTKFCCPSRQDSPVDDHHILRCQSEVELL